MDGACSSVGCTRIYCRIALPPVRLPPNCAPLFLPRQSDCSLALPISAICMEPIFIGSSGLDPVSPALLQPVFSSSPFRPLEVIRELVPGCELLHGITLAHCLPYFATSQRCAHYPRSLNARFPDKDQCIASAPTKRGDTTRSRSVQLVEVVAKVVARGVLEQVLDRSRFISFLCHLGFSLGLCSGSRLLALAVLYHSFIYLFYFSSGWLVQKFVCSGRASAALERRLARF